MQPGSLSALYLNAMLPRADQATLAIVDYHRPDSGTFIQ
jgi:hypothetical protein